MSENINFRLSMQDGLSAVLRGAEGRLRSFGDAADEVKKRLGMTNEQLLKTGAALGASSAAIGAASYAMGRVIGGWADSAGKLETSITNLKYNAIADLKNIAETEEEFGRITKKVMDTGKNSLYSATEASDAFYELFSYGLQGSIVVTDNFGKHFKRKTAEMALDATLNYSTMTRGLVSLADAAAFTGAVINKTNLDMGKVTYDEEGEMVTLLDRVYDKVAKASVISGLKPEEMPSILNSARMAMSQVNMEMSTALALVGQLKTAGMGSAEAGNKLVEWSRVMSNMQTRFLNTDMYAAIRAQMGKDPVKGVASMLGKRQTYWTTEVFGSRKEFEEAIRDQRGNFRDAIDFMGIMDAKLESMGLDRVNKMSYLKKLLGTTEAASMFLNMTGEGTKFIVEKDIYAVDEWGTEIEGAGRKLLYTKGQILQGIAALKAMKAATEDSKGASKRYAEMIESTLEGQVKKFRALKDTVKSQYGKYVGELMVGGMHLLNGMMRLFSAFEEHFPNVARALTWLLVTLTAVGAALAVIGLPLAAISLALGRFSTIGSNLGKLTGVKFLLNTMTGKAAAATGKAAGKAVPGKAGIGLLDTFFAYRGMSSIAKSSSIAEAAGSKGILRRFIDSMSGFVTAGIPRTNGLATRTLTAEARGLVSMGDGLLSSGAASKGLTKALYSLGGAAVGTTGVTMGLSAKLTSLAGGSMLSLATKAGAAGTKLFGFASKFGSVVAKPLIFFTGFLDIFKGIFSLFTDSSDKSKSWLTSFKDFFKYIGGAVALFKKGLFGESGIVTGEDIDAAGTLGTITLKLMNNPVFRFFRRITDFSNRVDKNFNEMVESISKLSSDITGEKLIDPKKLFGAGLIGRGVGGIAGFAIGTAVGGPVLGMLGAFLGGWIGKRLGEWAAVFIQAATSPDGLEKIMPLVIETVSKNITDLTNMARANSIELVNIFKAIISLVAGLVKGLAKGLVEAWRAGVDFSIDRVMKSSTTSEGFWGWIGVGLNAAFPVIGELVFQLLKALCEGIANMVIEAATNPQTLSRLIGMVVGVAVGSMAGPLGMMVGAAAGEGVANELYRQVNGGDYRVELPAAPEVVIPKVAGGSVDTSRAIPSDYASVDTQGRAASEALARSRAQDYDGFYQPQTTERNVNITVDFKNVPKDMGPSERKKYMDEVRAVLAQQAAKEEFRDSNSYRSRAGIAAKTDSIVLEGY